MAIIRNLAMTPEEMGAVSPLPEGAAWMSCHFSGSGLQDLPESLPPDSLLILDDRIPPVKPDGREILEKLTEVIHRFHCQGLLLDFQRSGSTEAAELAGLLSEALPCPVGVSEAYAQASQGPVFLPLLPPHRSLREYLSPWKGREIWLEVGPGAEQAHVTAKGTQFTPPEGPLPEGLQAHQGLHCHYHIQLKEEEILFTLLRTKEDLEALTAEAEGLGVTRTVGLYQELS